MKVTVEMLEYANVKYSWSTIYVALRHKFIENDEVVNYAIKEMEKEEYKYNEFINDLIFEKLGNNEIIRRLREEKIINESLLRENDELLKIQYVMLLNLKERFIDSKERLFKEIAEVYADFDYPESMSRFIYYMPSDELLNDENEGKDKMMLNFNNYLSECFQKIKKEYK